MKPCPFCHEQIQDQALVCKHCQRELQPLASPMGIAPSTSGLAIASLVLGILGICSYGLLGLVGLILGIVALGGINKSQGRIGGRGLAIGGIASGGATMLIGFMLMAAIAIPNFMKFQAKAKQSEARTNLGAVYTAQTSHFGEEDSFGDSFDAIAWKPEGQTRYSYFLPNQTILNMQGGPECQQLPPEVTAAASQEGFLAVASGNIDSDATCDIWVINEKRELQNLQNDVMQ